MRTTEVIGGIILVLSTLGALLFAYLVGRDDEFKRIGKKLEDIGIGKIDPNQPVPTIVLKWHKIKEKEE